jgi:hypothetical protein
VDRRGPDPLAGRDEVPSVNFERGHPDPLPSYADFEIVS